MCVCRFPPVPTLTSAPHRHFYFGEATPIPTRLAKWRAGAAAPLAQVSLVTGTSPVSLISCELVGKHLDASKPLFVHL